VLQYIEMRGTGKALPECQQGGGMRCQANPSDLLPTINYLTHGSLKKQSTRERELFDIFLVRC
jgi:hypothetical protein